MAAPCPLLGDGVTDDALLHIARFLSTAKDLLRLQLTNKRFNTKCIADTEHLAKCPVSQVGETGHTRGGSTDRPGTLGPHNTQRHTAGGIQPPRQPRPVPVPW